MEKRIDRLVNKSFKETLLDSPVPNEKVKFPLSRNKSKSKSKWETIKSLPDPLKPTNYIPPKPTPKPTSKPTRKPTRKPIPKPRVLSKRPVPLPRPIPKPIDKKVKKLIDEITPYYKPEAIEAFKKSLRVNPRVKITEKRQALRNRVKSLEVSIIERKDPAKQLYFTTPDVAKELESILSKERGMKVQTTLHVTFKKKKISYRADGQAEEVFEYKDAYFNSKAFSILNEYEIIEALDKAAEELNNKIAVWLSEGSGWLIVEIRSHFVNIVKYLPLRGNSYLPLPEELRNSKKGLINIKNEDNKCFLWCHNRHKNPQKKNPQKITGLDRELVKKLDYSGITFPVTVNQINRIEKQNKININLIGYDIEKKAAFPIKISQEHYDDHLELLYLEKGGDPPLEPPSNSDLKERGDLGGIVPQSHYVLIKDFNRFMYNFTKHKERKHFCMHCLQCFYSNQNLAKHKVNCIVINGAQASQLPEKYIDKNGIERTPCV